MVNDKLLNDMKKIILMLFVLVAACVTGCKENEEGGNLPVQVDLSKIEFTPIAGGAIMSYILPDDARVYGIKASFTSTTTGREEVVIGTYGGNELTIKGFLEAQSAVKVRLSLLGFDESESKAVEASFQTLAASTLSLFDDLEVNPFWGGFTVEFNAPENTDGFVNVGYKGIDPNTQQPGIILKETKLIEPGDNRLSYNDLPMELDQIEAVIWTEDFSGNEVYRQSYQVIPYFIKLLEPSTIDYSGNSLESEYEKIGLKYLFDGDSKGIEMLKAQGAGRVQEHYMYMSQDAPILKPEVVLDMGEEQQLASFRLYEMPNNGVVWYTYVLYMNYDGYLANIPNHFKVFGSNDNAQWTELGEVFEATTMRQDLWWCYPTVSNLIYRTPAELENADPCYAEINFDATQAPYRYLKVQFLSTWLPTYPGYERIMASEMEIYVKR